MYYSRNMLGIVSKFQNSFICYHSLPRIYTKTGDKGKSSLFTGERRLKDDDIFNALGTTDELSCNIGLSKALAKLEKHPYVDELETIQCLLQDIGSDIATPKKSDTTRLDELSENVKYFEILIDGYTLQLQPLKNFILSGGSLITASLHISRTVCRRAERQIATLVRKEEAPVEVLRFFNRLSDYLFTLARYAAHLTKEKESIYRRINPKK